MLLRFGVSNHLSFRDRQEFSLVASPLKDRREGLIDCPASPSGHLVPAALIYGANASGKTNLLSAFELMRDAIVQSWTQEEAGVGRSAFLLSAEAAGRPSCFDVDLVLEGVRYQYGFEASDEAFEAEWLYEFPRGRGRLLFVREAGGFRFGRSLRGRNQLVSAMTRPSRLFLSVAAQHGYEGIRAIRDYFRSIGGMSDLAELYRITESLNEMENVDDRIIAFLSNMNTGVSGYRKRPITTEERIESVHNTFITGGPRVNFQSKATELTRTDDKGNPIHFPLEFESAGTLRLFHVLDMIFRALDQGSLVFIDELNASLHTQAAEAVLALFCSHESNPKGAQLIATTHDTNLLRSPLLRRDQIWFTEKAADGASTLYPLTDFHLRKGDNIERAYLQGRLGAVPSDDLIADLV